MPAGRCRVVRGPASVEDVPNSTYATKVLSMRRMRLVPAATAALLLLLFTVGCKDSTIPSSPGPGRLGADISDAVHTPTSSGSDLAKNPYFWWLAPIAPQPDRSGFGTFDPTLQPTVRIVCLKTTDSSVTSCDPGTALATFSLDNGGLTVNDSLYIASFDLSKQNPALALSAPDLSKYTTYRIEVLTPALGGGLGGPHIFGFVDFRVGDNGTEAHALTRPDSVLGVTDTQTLPIKFRLDKGALAHELRQYTDGGLCGENCSVTQLDPNGTTDACLTQKGGTKDLTCLESTPGAVSGLTFLVIDQRSLGQDGNCAPGVTLKTDDCFRYVLLGNGGSQTFFGGDPNQFVVYGICPIPSYSNSLVDGSVVDSHWRLLKADYDATTDSWQVTAPNETEAPFLHCDVHGTEETALGYGPLGRVADKLLNWLVPPVEASHFTGGQLNGLSDLFWGLDAVIEAVEPTTFSALSGAIVQPTVKVVAVHPDPSNPEPLSGMPVAFKITSASGTSSLSSGTESGDSVMVTTDANGEASVDLTVLGAVGSSVTVEASSPQALLASGVAGAITFTTTVTAGAQPVLYGVNSQDDGLSIIDPDGSGNVSVTHVGTTLDASGKHYAAPMSMATDPNGALYVWNNSGNPGSNSGSLLAVDRCTGTASRLLNNGQGHFQALSSDAAGSGVFYGLGTSAYRVTVTGTSQLGSSPSFEIGGADTGPDGSIYALEKTTAPGATGPRLVTIDPNSGAASPVATLSEDVGTVGSIVFRSDGTLIGSSISPKGKNILFYFTTAGEVTNTRHIEHGEYAPDGMAFAPACPTP